MKRPALFILFLLILSTLIACGKEVAKTPSSEELKKQQQLVSDFKSEISVIEKENQKMAELYHQAMTQVGKTVSISDAYHVAKNAKDFFEISRSKAFNIKISKELPDDTRKILSEAQLSFTSSCNATSESIKHAMAFLDSNKLSDLEAYKEQLEFAKNDLEKFSSKMTEAENKVGLSDSLSKQ